MTQRRALMTHGLIVLALATGLVDCGKYGRPSRLGPGPSQTAGPAEAEACEEKPAADTAAPAPAPSPPEATTTPTPEPEKTP